MVGLTTKQKEELNLAIHEYLLKNKFNQTADMLAQEAGFDANTVTNNGTAAMKDILEKKWTSVVKLKKQVMELEKQLKQQKELGLCERCGGDITCNPKTGEEIKSTEGLPRQPEKFTLQGHRSRITKVALHPIYSIVATASEDASIKIWDYDQGELEQTMKSHTGIVNYIAFHPNGKILASCSTDMTVKLWNLQSHTVFKTLQGHEHEVSSVEFMPGGDFLLSSSRDHTIKMWDTNTGFCIQTIKGHTDWVKRVAVNHKGSLMASSSKDETIIIWNMDRIKSSNPQKDAIISILNEHEHVIDCVKWAPAEACSVIDKADYNKNYFAMLSLQGSEGVADTSVNGGDESSTTVDAESEETKDDSMVVNTSNQQLSTKDKILQMKNAMKQKREALKKKDDVVVVEEEKKQEQQASEEQRDYLASGSRDKTIKIWEVRNGRCVLTLTGHDNWVTDLVFHPNGRFLLSVSDDKSIRIWDLTNGRQYRKMLNAHDHFISSIDMKAKVVVTGSVDTTAKVWPCR